MSVGWRKREKEARGLVDRQCWEYHTDKDCALGAGVGCYDIPSSGGIDAEITHELHTAFLRVLPASYEGFGSTLDPILAVMSQQYACVRSLKGSHKCAWRENKFSLARAFIVRAHAMYRH